MSDQPLEQPRESLDQRAAKVLNVVMVTLIGICAAVAIVWMVVFTTPPVLAIYRSLTDEQHRQLSRFGIALWPVLFGAVWGLRSLGAWLERRNIDRGK
jgi:hypothetical protein